MLVEGLAADREQPLLAPRHRRARAAARGRMSSSMSWMSVPRSAASGSFAERLERPQPQDISRRRSHRDRGSASRSASPKAASAAARPAARAAGASADRSRAARRGCRAQREHLRAARPHRRRQAPRRHRRSAAAASARRRAARRPARSARVSHTSGWPSACAKSCAARPIRRSGGSSASAARIGRESSGSSRVCAGHVPSFRPPSTTMSTLCRRASSAPQMWMRGSSPPRRRTVARSISAAKSAGIVARRDVGPDARWREAPRRAGASASPASSAEERRRPASSSATASRAPRCAPRPDRRARRPVFASRALKRRERRLDALGEIARGLPISSRDRQRAASVGTRPSPPSGQRFAAKRDSSAWRSAARPGLQPRAAQHGALEASRGAMRVVGALQPEGGERMLQKREQRLAPPPAKRRLRDEPRQHARAASARAAGRRNRRRRSPSASSSTATRRASPRSGVTSAATCPASPPPAAGARRRRAPPRARSPPRSDRRPPSASRLRPQLRAPAARSSAPPCSPDASLRRRNDRAPQRRRLPPRASDRHRRVPRRSLCSSSFRPYCGWPAPAGSSRRSTPIASQLSASRPWSSPGSTTAPFGSRAIAASSAAVAGTEPVEPAAITGAGEPCAASRSASRADQQIAPRARIDQAALGQMLGPELRGDPQELQRDVPVAREIGRHALRRARARPPGRCPPGP